MKKGLIKSEKDIEGIAASGAILARVLRATAELVCPGVTTAQLNAYAEGEIKKAGGTPSFKGYGSGNPFPAGLCTSVNEEVVHGVPGDYVLQEGDVIGLDLGVKYKGYFSDAAVTVSVGKTSKEAEKLMRVTQEALLRAIKAAKPGNFIGDISHAIQVTAEDAGFSPVRELVGHGVGFAVHEDPEVPCYGRAGMGMRLVEGMVIAIEPMIVEGSWRTTSEPGEWPVKTMDGKLAAHFEHTIAITKKGPVILTK